MYALHQEILAPSGVEFAAWLKITATEGIQSNLVVARSNLLRIFEVREEKFYHVRTHRLHGIVTGLEGVKVMGSLEDGRDRLLVGFKDAKIALLEWSDALYDFTTVSIHTYERAPQCLDIKASFRSLLRVDPISRCAALLLPQDALAVLPFHQNEELIHPTQGDQIDVDSEGSSRSDIPYFPSYILDLPQSVSSSIHNIIDFTFLPGFHNPTIAVLFNERQTWTGRLEEAKDTCGLIIFSMSNSFSSWGGMSSAFTVITNITNLPYDAYALVPCTAGVAGLVILTPNSVVYVDQATKKLMLPVNGWATRVSDVSVVPISPAAQTRDLALEGSRATFISETTLLLILTDGNAYTVTLAMDGKTVSGLSISDKPLAKTTIPSLAMSVTTTSTHTGASNGDDIPCIFVGSTQGPSVLLRTTMTEEDDVDAEMNDGKNAGLAAGVEDEDVYDDDADIYGPSHAAAPDAKKKEARRRDEKKRKLKLQLLLADYLPSYGSINDMVFGLTRNGDKPAPILIAATSTSHHGGFTLFQRDLPVKVIKRRMHILGGTKGLWSFALQKKGNGTGDAKEIMMIISTDANPSPGFSRITIPPFASSVSSTPSIANISNNDITARIQGTSVGAGPFFGGLVVLQVMTGSIRVLESDGTERQVIKDIDSSSSSTVSTPRARIRACSISDPYVLILREDDTMGLFIGEASKGKLRRKDMSMLGGKTSRYLTGCFFTDHTGMLEKNISSPNPKIDLGQRSSNGLNNQWLLLVRPQGILELWTLPKMTLAFSVGTPFATLENVLVDSGEAVALSVPVSATTISATAAVSSPALPNVPAPVITRNQSQMQDVLMTPVESEAGDIGVTATNKEKAESTNSAKEMDGRDNGVIEQVLVAPLGETIPELHLFVLLRSGQLAVYQAIPAPVLSHPSPSAIETPNGKGVEPTSPTSVIPVATPSSTSPPNSRLAHLRLAFVKVLSKTFELQNSNVNGTGSGPGGGMISSGGGLADLKKFSRMFVPFKTPSSRQLDNQSENEIPTYSGVFFTGENPSWIISTDRGGVHLFPSGHAVVHAFTACPVLTSKDLRGGVIKGEFLIYSDEGPTLLEWIPEFELNFPLPARSVPRGRAYSSVVFDPSTSLVVAAAALQASFASFDEDNNRIWTPDASNISDPTTECSTLELISPELWVSMDGYEFATNEVVNAVACVTLETASTETGSKEFIAVGTTINRGEDLAAKGATYIFEIVEVVADSVLAPHRWYKLRLRCRDDAKGPVTALCGLNGYLVSSMGQKIFVRAFDSDERLVGIAFMDVGVYVTSLRTIKNLLLIGDAVKSVSFVAFQEDPYKLILLAKDTRHLCVTAADFFFADNDMAIFTHDEEGILRLYDYNPLDLESRDGRYLLMRSEFNSQAEYRTTALIARRTSTDTVVPQAKLICGATNGSIAAITPVDELAAKRLQLLQGQLTRNIQHIAGLNPRALRIVRNDYVSKTLSKGVLDANLLVHFENSSITKQIEMTKQIGTEVRIVQRDWMALEGPW
ncbi:CPSF A subunit region-domain-containing protein [Lentinula aciculospora]|uniref:CPSF A subunit region-domain-containing protein n=1 Tax=Lentinula aciculospora TaxID=153920 RepID=A0A9W9DR13_9AGAR|nr:CPSF A subunit region-domain-containing protein [Lentinula aciculospora]